MILLDKLHYMLLLASLVFALTMLIRIFIEIKSIRYALMGVVYFVIIAFVFPFKVSNTIYKNRESLIKKINSDSNLNTNQKDKIKKVIQSRGVLFFIFTKHHILRLPTIIENHIVLYAKWYNKLVVNKNKRKSRMLTLYELNEMIDDKISDLSTSLKEITT